MLMDSGVIPHNMLIWSNSTAVHLHGLDGEFMEWTVHLSAFHSPSLYLIRVCIRETWPNQADIKQSHGNFRKVPAPTAYLPMMCQVQIVQSNPTRCPTSSSRRSTGRGQQHISCYISFAHCRSPASPQVFKRVTSCQGTLFSGASVILQHSTGSGTGVYRLFVVV